jgi:hypothetical protein
MTTERNPDRVLVIACGALAHELVRVKELNHWDHIDFQCLPAELHNYPEKIPAAVQDKIRENRERYENILVGYSDCGTGGLLDVVLEKEGVDRLPGAHCYEMFSGSEAFQNLHEAELGTFYLTDFLAIHFERLVIKGLGLDRFPQLKEQYFGYYKKLVYLAQKEDSKVDQKALEAARFLDLEYEKISTGDGFLEAAIAVRIGSSKSNY